MLLYSFHLASPKRCGETQAADQAAQLFKISFHAVPFFLQSNDLFLSVQNNSGCRSDQANSGNGNQAHVSGLGGIQVCSRTGSRRLGFLFPSAGGFGRGLRRGRPGFRLLIFRLRPWGNRSVAEIKQSGLSVYHTGIGYQRLEALAGSIFVILQLSRLPIASRKEPLSSAKVIMPSYNVFSWSLAGTSPFWAKAIKPAR